jgi:hypothetical protein
MILDWLPEDPHDHASLPVEWLWGPISLSHNKQSELGCDGCRCGKGRARNRKRYAELRQPLSWYWRQFVSLRKFPNLRLADLRLTAAQQWSTGRNLPAALYRPLGHIYRISFYHICIAGNNNTRFSECAIYKWTAYAHQYCSNWVERALQLWSSVHTHMHARIQQAFSVNALFIINVNT